MADSDVLHASGYTGDLTFDGRTVTIRHNWRGKVSGWKDPHEIELLRVQEMEFSPATMFSNGYLRLIVPGETDPDVRVEKNKVYFTKKQARAFEDFGFALNRAIRERGPISPPETDIQVGPEGLEVVRFGPGHIVTKVSYSVAEEKTGAVRVKETSGARAVFESGADTSRPTLTRIGAGALLAGPIGAVGGALLKKNTSKCYVTVVFQDGDSVIIEGPIKDEMKLRQFAADVNRLAAN